MKNIKNTTCIVITLGITTIFCAGVVLAQTDKSGSEDWRATAAEATKRKMWGLIHYYKPTDDQKAKLQKALIAQYKDLMDYDKIRAPKIKVLDDEIEVVRTKINELKKEIEVIEKRKAVHTSVRRELLLDHEAEIANIFTQEQRVARLSNQIQYSAVGYQYLNVLPKETRDLLVTKCNAVALDIIKAGNEGDKRAINEACMKMRLNNKGLITPEIRTAGETKRTMGGVLRRFVRTNLTETQKDTIRDMCEKAVKRKGELYSQYEQATKDRTALRNAMIKISSPRVQRQIIEEVIENVLTEAQLQQGRFKKKKSSKPKSSK